MSEIAERACRVVCWGEVLWDLFPDGDRLGGCAANVAFHVARLGAEARLVSRVGGDELGGRAVRQLARAGVDVELVQQDPEHATGTVRVEVEDGEPRFCITEQAAWDRIEWTESTAAAVRDADVLYYGTLAQRTPLGSGALRSAWAEAPATCLRVCDVNLRRPFPVREVVADSLREAAVVKLNERELGWLSELFGCGDPIPWLLGELGVDVVALTLGARGCELHARGGRHVHPGFPLEGEGGDRVGAGDAFTAVLCASLARGGGLAGVAERANRVASFVASRPGATPSWPTSLLQDRC